MSTKPTYQELEQRIADLESELDKCRQDRSAAPDGNFPATSDACLSFLPAIINNTQNMIYVKDTEG